MERKWYVYILASRKDGALYIGITNDLMRRIHEHREEWNKGHTQHYHIHKLVYYEAYDDPENAILREKRLKKWRREWKLELIEKDNPPWRDLYETLI